MVNTDSLGAITLAWTGPSFVWFGTNYQGDSEGDGERDEGRELDRRGSRWGGRVKKLPERRLRELLLGVRKN